MSALLSARNIGRLAREVCVREATAAKLGNVHPSAAFADMNYDDMLRSAQCLEDVLQHAGQWPVGRLVEETVAEIAESVGKNTYLGTIMLLAPLARAACVHPEVPLRQAVKRVLQSLTTEDARAVYAAIRRANPGGLGRVASHDVSQTPPADLLVAMQQAATRDLVARQYANGFEEVFEFGLPQWLSLKPDELADEEAIVVLQLHWLARYPDSLIHRKCGLSIATETSRRAARILALRGERDPEYRSAMSEFDQWLRADGHRRNPGTTADLVAATLFVEKLSQAKCDA
jgi:triphosphoribosyl-dephospho-CoA synthase